MTMPAFQESARETAIRLAEARGETLTERGCEVWAKMCGGVERLAGRGESPEEAWEKAAASYRRLAAGNGSR